jgi:hypothetical protein
VKNQIVEVRSVEEFDQLSDTEQLIAQITHVRLQLYNAGRSCGTKAIQKQLQDEGLSPVPTVPTIARALVRRHLTNGRTGYYPEDYAKDEEVQ